MRVRLWGTALTLLLTAAALPAGTAVAASAGRAQRPPAPLPLARLFDNTAISDNSGPGEADFDGAGHSLSAQDLAAAGWSPGSVLTIDSARLEWPRRRSGAADNVIADGQPVALHGRGDALTFLVAGTGGSGDGVTGNGSVRYRDGSRGGFELTAPDWRSGPLSTKAVALPHINGTDGQQGGRPGCTR